jgi:2-polyprenyl-3-methyl-5-hydroxy-6-metoxy-1,4-benzoquinol methylase/Tfp pilus assembly protein PilF
MIALQQGRPQDTVDLIAKAIAANYRIAPYHAGIAEAYRALGNAENAITHFRKATELQPDHWAAHNQLADILRDHGDLRGAADHYTAAVKLKPDFASAQHNLAAVLIDQGRPNEALHAVTHALALRDDATSRELFVECVRNADRIPGVPQFRTLVTRALQETWSRPAEFGGPAIALIVNNPTVATAVRAAAASWPRRLSPAECSSAISVLAGDDLLHAVLNSTVVSDPGLERLLTSVRMILLDAAVQAKSEVSGEMVNFAAALARQCFINEYVFDVSNTERQALALLRSNVRSALTGGSPVFAIHLIALAAYAPLNTLEQDEMLLGRSWLKPLEGLITEQVREPKAEAALRDAMPRLTAIADEVSQKVRDQYEDNPYPRWFGVPQTPPTPGIDAHVRALFPKAPIVETPKPAVPDILIAGCGTGQQSIGTAQRFPMARILAIDLSLTSLAYAKRKSAALGVVIDYAQADILELTLDRRFDLIESSGVLHHLADPMRGWAAVLKLLKPGGFMRLGLYSQLGRQNIIELRDLIAERGYQPTAHDIRRCRQEIISKAEPRFAPITHSPDFCSVSGCRDLLFHVQEHRLTLPQINDFLRAQNLTFLGFEISIPVLARYQASHPDAAQMSDLALWHRFESEFPDTFGGMYNFWVQKAP